MPNWNRARVSNLYFNRGTRQYDDFRMTFGGKDTTYELTNGGGKTVFLLAVLQNVLPNTSIDHELPFKDVFKDLAKQETMHALLEWNLDDDYHHRYMLTGFCAREKREKNLDESIPTKDQGIEYFNYCIFYNEPNAYDINNLPLREEIDGKVKRMAFLELKNYLKKLREKGIAVKVFDSTTGGRGAYLKFLSEYNIFEAEWDIIKSVNKTENYIKTYFRDNMKTSRKLIESFLLPIIEKSNATKTHTNGEENVLVETLYSIREILKELLAKKEKSHEYTEILLGYEYLRVRIQDFKEVYLQQEQAIFEFNANYNFVLQEINGLMVEIDGITEQIAKNQQSERQLECKGKALEAQRTVIEIKQKEEELLDQQTKRDKVAEQVVIQTTALAQKEAMNSYFNYEEQQYKLERKQLEKTALEQESQNENQMLEKAGVVYYLATQQERQDLETKLLSKKEQAQGIANHLVQVQGEQEQAQVQKGTIQTTVTMAAKRKQEIETKLENEYSALKDDARLVLQPKDHIETLQLDLEEQQTQLVEVLEQEQQAHVRINELQENVQGFKQQHYELTSQMKNSEQAIQTYEKERQKAIQKEDLYHDGYTGEALIVYLSNFVKEMHQQLAHNQNTQNHLEERLQDLMANKVISLSPRMKELENYLTSHYQSVATGTEYLQALTTTLKEGVLKNIPYLPYCLILSDADFKKAEKDKHLIDRFAGDILYPILNLDAIRLGQTKLIASEYLFFVAHTPDIFINSERIEQEKEKTEKEIFALQRQKEQLEEALAYHTANLKVIERFYEMYHTTDYEAQKVGLEKLQVKIQKAIDAEAKTSRILQQEKESLQTLEGKKAKLAKQTEELGIYIQQAIQYVELNTQHNQVTQEIAQATKSEVKIEEALATLKFTVSNLNVDKTASEQDCFNLQSLISRLVEEQEQIVYDAEKVAYYKEHYKKEVSVPYQTAKVTYTTLYEASKGKLGAIQNIQEQIVDAQKQLVQHEESVTDRGYTLEHIKGCIEEQGIVSQISKEVLKALQQEILTLQKTHEQEKDVYTELDKVLSGLQSKLEVRIDAIREDYHVTFEPLPIDTVEVLEHHIQSNRQQLKEIQMQLRNDLQLRKVQENKKQVYESQLERAKLYIQDKGIVFQSDVLATEPIALEQCIDNYKRVIVRIQGLEAKLQTSLTELIEKYKHFNIREFITSLEKDIKPPTSLKEAERLETNIVRSLDIIQIKLEKIEGDIQNIESYRENFVHQCVQRCEDVYKDLEKLQSLSRIMLGGMPRDMIALDVKLRSEEDRLLSMRHYIDKIMADIEEIQDEAELKDALGARLALKQLFAQIVVDMNKVKVKLYKVEELDRDSQYKPWEEAVGSAGQSNGLYLTFLICIISYIKKLNAKNEQADLKKVVVVDNPFAASSSYYIWAPIMEIAKQNNTQIIAPGHSIPKEVLSMIEVKYLLKSVVNTEYTTIVVDDIRSEIDLEVMEYKKIMMEQLMF